MMQKTRTNSICGMRFLVSGAVVIFLKNILTKSVDTSFLACYDIKVV